MTALCTSPRRQRQFYRDTVCLHWFVVASGLAYVKDFVLFFFFFAQQRQSPYPWPPHCICGGDERAQKKVQ